MAFSFTTSGATPNNSYGGLFNSPQKDYGGLTASTPQAKALSTAKTPNTSSSYGLLYGGPATGTQGTSYNTSPAFPGGNPISQSSSPAVKKVTTEYHVPIAPSTSGILNPNAGVSTSAFNSAPQGTPATQAQNTTANGTVAGQNTSFPGLIGSLANQGQQSQASQQGLQQSQEAFHGTQNYIDQLKQSRLNEASALQEQAEQPIPLGDITGRQQAISSYYAQQQAGLGAAGQAESNLYSPGLNAAVTGQGQQIGALNNAAGFAQPQLGQYGQGYYNPLDPTGGAASAGGGALNPINNVSSIAQQVISGQISPQQAYSMGGTIANWQSLLNAAIQQTQPGFNSASAQGQFDARQQNTTTAGTAPTNAYASTYAQNYPAYVATQQQLSNVEGIGNLLLNTAQGGQVNPFTPQLANQTIAQFRSQLSSPDQQRFNSTLAAFQGSASQLLTNSSGQIPTDVSNNISAIANGNLSLGALKAMVDQAKLEGNIKLQTAGGAVNTPGSAIGAPSVNTSSGDYQSYLQSIGAH